MDSRQLVSITALLLAGVVTGCQQSGSPTSAPASGTESSAQNPGPAGCSPLETRQAEVPSQRPTTPDQTRACAITSAAAYEVTVLAKGLEHPWAVEPLPNGDLLVTERPGRLRIISAQGQTGEPIKGLPAVYATGQGGLLDVALSPTFATDQLLYWSFAEPRGAAGNATSVARGVLSPDRRSVSQVKVIFQALPAYNGDKHFGSRLAFGPDGMLYVSLGERSDLQIRPQAQQLNSHMGKILRLTPEGRPAPDNPFAKQAGALPEIWTVGQRNVQATAFDAQGQLWSVDMGPQGGDELNRLEGGKNYGWPLVTFGEEYSGEPIPNSVTTKPGYVDPVYYWDPVIAPSGAQFYSGSAFPAWQGNLFVGSLKDRNLVRLQLENGRVTGEERLLSDRKQRVRDVKQGPDGALYVVTDEGNGELWKITPSAAGNRP
ncbi:PQQ-dependent sugar dehydrogenase [Hymenobacter actinosclerus]|uniref:Glucose/arabinose dehydrogenase, beta-propeller fold n=1 Tax=Hymenobacter actinosclerus TaxID=82805 RepID=A0A1I0GP35_9BACT|nr:PQQ-dependent sugar dehydrogenase [Hymenobacter actinosclerus]SET72023.1 Glucose/arabinose dehydrogenase, beta-propeller fold [Hymenobacter actinosclerus]